MPLSFPSLHRAVQNWLRPKATDRDIAFRERAIRYTLAIIIVLVLIGLAINILVFRGPRTIISYFSLHVVVLAACLVSAFFVSHRRIVLAGWLLVTAILLAANIILLLARQEESAAGIIIVIPAFMFVPLAATQMLPRGRILPTTLLCVLTYAVSQFVLPVNNFVLVGVEPNQLLFSVMAALIGEGVLLRQLLIEFDDRFDTLVLSIHEMNAAKEDAEQARKRAEDADRAKTQFLAHMSHELRTPMNAIIGYDEIMLGGMAGTFTPKQTDLLARIQQNSRRLLVLINDVLDLSKIESGSVELFLGMMSPRKVVAESVESLQSLAQEKGIYLSVDFSDALPEIVMGDSRKIQQILVNLVSNAIKFTDTGGVVVRTEALDSIHWQVSVQDTGIGIPEDSLALIFEPFRQVDSSETRKYKGTGLGLAISKRLTERMGGTIEVRTSLGKGSTFVVSLPKTPATAEKDRVHATDGSISAVE